MSVCIGPVCMERGVTWLSTGVPGFTGIPVVLGTNGWTVSWGTATGTVNGATGAWNGYKI